MQRVATQLEPLDALLFRGVGGQHDDGGEVVDLADVLQKREAILARENDVDDAQIVRVRVVGLRCHLPVFEINHFIALHFKIILNDVAQVFALVN